MIQMTEAEAEKHITLCKVACRMLDVVEAARSRCDVVEHLPIYDQMIDDARSALDAVGADRTPRSPTQWLRVRGGVWNDLRQLKGDIYSILMNPNHEKDVEFWAKHAQETIDRMIEVARKADANGPLPVA